MKKRRLIYYLLLLGGAALFLCNAGYAAGTNGTIQVNNNQAGYFLKNNLGAIIAPDNALSPTNILFFTSAPADPRVAQSGVAADKLTASRVGEDGPYRYDITGTDGTTVYILVKSDKHYAISSRGYFFDTSTATKKEGDVKLSASNPLIYELNFQTINKMDTPYKPASITIAESQNRIGATQNTETTLTITVAPHNGASPDLIQIGGGNPGNYALQIVKEGDAAAAVAVNAGDLINGPSVINQAGGTFVIKGPYLEAGKKYNLTAWNRNWFTQAGDAGVNTVTSNWTILGANAQAGPQEFTITLLRGTGNTPGINNFSMPIAPNNPSNPAAADYGWFVGAQPVTNAEELKAAIVAAAGGAEIVSSIGEWDAQNGVVRGVMLGADGSVSAGVGGANKLSDIWLYPGKGYQVYLTPAAAGEAREIRLTIRNTKQQ